MTNRLTVSCKIVVDVWGMLSSAGTFIVDIVTNRSRKHLTAWLGLIAMWLVVFAPIVSQLVVSAEPHPYASMCGQMQMGDMPIGNMHMAAADGGVAGSGHRASKPAMAACGYCDLLATHTAMPAPTRAAESVFMLVVFAAAPVLFIRFMPAGAFPSGRPRAPPRRFLTASV